MMPVDERCPQQLRELIMFCRFLQRRDNLRADFLMSLSGILGFLLSTFRTFFRGGYPLIKFRYTSPPSHSPTSFAVSSSGADGGGVGFLPAARPARALIS